MASRDMHIKFPLDGWEFILAPSSTDILKFNPFALFLSRLKENVSIMLLILHEIKKRENVNK